MKKDFFTIELICLDMVEDKEPWLEASKSHGLAAFYTLERARAFAQGLQDRAEARYMAKHGSDRSRSTARSSLLCRTDF